MASGVSGSEGVSRLAIESVFCSITANESKEMRNNLVFFFPCADFRVLAVKTGEAAMRLAFLSRSAGSQHDMVK